MRFLVVSSRPRCNSDRYSNLFYISLIVEKQRSEMLFITVKSEPEVANSNKISFLRAYEVNIVI